MAPTRESMLPVAKEPLKVSGVSPQEVAMATNAMGICLGDLRRTNKIVQEFFGDYADEELEDGSPGLSLAATRQMTPLLAQALGLPVWLFRDIDLQHDRYDFDGDGLLREADTWRLFRHLIRHRRSELAGTTEQPDVPWSSLNGEGYRVKQELGRGGQGVMYLCKKSCDIFDRKYCVKFYDKTNPNSCDLDEVLLEYTRMKQFDHPNVAKTYELFQDSDFFYLVNEPYFGGDLTKLAKRADDAGVSMSENWWRGIFRQCLLGLGHLHSKEVVHCDIKEPNIMIAQDSYLRPHIVLIDFGLSSPFATLEKNWGGTAGYMPPETYEDGVWGPKGDIFSMGVVFFHVMAGRIPTKHGTIGPVLAPSHAPHTEALAHVSRYAPLPWEQFPSGVDELRDLIVWMTDRQRRERPKAPQALEHEWFSSDSDTELPEEVIRSLIAGAANSCDEEGIVEQLRESNMDELRTLSQEFAAKDRNRRGGVPQTDFVALLKGAGVRKADAEAYAEAIADSTGLCSYKALMEEALVAKETYDRQSVVEIIDELDEEDTGYVRMADLDNLLREGVLECDPGQVQIFRSASGMKGDGLLSREAVTRAVLENGSIRRRADLEESQDDASWSTPLCAHGGVNGGCVVT